MSTYQEYIVTTHNMDDADSLYDQIISPVCSADCVPDRAVEVACERPTSRNTHYYLSNDEAHALSKDPRVLAVSSTLEMQGASPVLFWEQASEAWSKGDRVNSGDVNWGLLRCTLPAHIPGWSAVSSLFERQSATVTTAAAGKNVDIVIVDGIIDPTHPEFAVNSDGTGGSRVVQYNWYQHRAEVEGTSNGVYEYKPYIHPTNYSITQENNHGTHVAGIAAGNSHGWARSANIYNIRFTTPYVFDYVRAFHKHKPVNPATGQKNPTICNNSWGIAIVINETSISRIRIAGEDFTPPFTNEQYLSWLGQGPDRSKRLMLGARVYNLDVDFEDAMNDGIVMIGAAGNSSRFLSVPNDEQYNNYIEYTLFAPQALYCNRPSSPHCVDNILVGAVSAYTLGTSMQAEQKEEFKAAFSNTGSAVDIFAPGENIASSVLTGGVYDTRNSLYRINKSSGTSMSAPQVSGVVALLLESYPWMQQRQIKEYLEYHSKADQIWSPLSFNGAHALYAVSNNLYLYYHQSLSKSGLLWPKTNVWTSPAVARTDGREIGVRFPKTRIRLL